MAHTHTHCRHPNGTFTQFDSSSSLPLAVDDAVPAEKPAEPAAAKSPIEPVSFVPLQPSSTTAPVAAGKGKKLLGAVKVTQKINFDQIANSSSSQEPEPFAHYKKETISNSDKATSATSTCLSSIAISPKQSQSQSQSQSKSQFPPKQQSQPLWPQPQQPNDEMDRLGMGIRKMTFTHQSSTGNGNGNSNTVSATKSVCKQGISSTSYFSDEPDREREREIDDKLRRLDPSKGISSDMFFGKQQTADGENGDQFDQDEEDEEEGYDYGRRTSYASKSCIV